MKKHASRAGSDENAKEKLETDTILWQEEEHEEK